MLKMINKLLYILKNIMLIGLLISTIYIIIFMFQRLEKEIFGANFLEFLGVVAPFLILLILYIINAFLNQKSVKNCLFYNITSFLVMVTIAFFCYRTFMDQNMYLWHHYNYGINFTYFADQIAPLKVMLYVLAFADVLLIVYGSLEDKEIEVSKTTTDKKRKKEHDSFDLDDNKTRQIKKIDLESE